MVKSILFPAALAGACLIGGAAAAQSQNTLCMDGTGTLCSKLPVDLPGVNVSLGYVPDSNPSQPGQVGQTLFDYFSWQMFVALNWPADGNAQPLQGATITSDLTSPRIWEYYETVPEVYPDVAAIDTSACDTSGPGRLTLARLSKLSSNSFIEPFTPYPLIDAAGNFVMYDVRVNFTDANYVRQNKLNTYAGQVEFAKTNTAWNFPPGEGTTPGPIELKTSWRIFQSEAEAAGYFTMPAQVVVPADQTADKKAMCLNVTAGLTGMHIMQKISNPVDFSPYWVWATFEHADNAPDASTAVPAQSNTKATTYSTDPLSACTAPTGETGAFGFFNAGCTSGGDACVANAPPPEVTKDAKGNPTWLWQSSPPYAKTYLTDGTYGSQVARCWEVYESAKTVTEAYKTAFGTSVWSNYELVGAQWAQASSTATPTTQLSPYPAPIYLTNTTLETFLQLDPVIGKDGKGNTHASGSCITCHNNAADLVGTQSDFSFLSYNVTKPAE